MSFSYMESKMQEVYDAQLETENSLAYAFEKGFIDESLKPIKCYKCGGDTFTDKVTSMDGGFVSEKLRHCAKCGQQNGHWAHGYWQV